MIGALEAHGVLKLFDPFFYRRVARRESAVIITNVPDMHVCARMCLDADFPCGVFEYYIAGMIIDVKNQTKPVYDCLMDGPGMVMVHLSTPESKRINFHQFVRKMDISAGDNAVFISGTDVILSPSYLPANSFNPSPSFSSSSNSSSSPLSWTIRLSEVNYNTIVFKMLAVKGQIDCGNWSSFSLLSINGGGNFTASSGKVGTARCLNEFVVGETFNVDSAEVFITYFATDLIETGFMLEYNARWLCNQSFIASPGSISSPRFYSLRQTYPPNIRCHYSITAPPNLVVALHMDSYQIEPDMEEGACDFDSLSIFDGNSTDALRLEYLCGYSQAPVSVLSNSSSLYLVFSTDESGQYAGFAASFSFMDQIKGKDEEEGELRSHDEMSDFDRLKGFMYESSQTSKLTTTSQSTYPKGMTTSSKGVYESREQINHELNDDSLNKSTLAIMPKAKKKSVAGRKRGGETAPRATLPPSQAENPRADAALPPSQARKSPRARAKATSTPVGVGPSGADDQGGFVLADYN
ncbi:uncharacterized protein LOC105445114 [Strongylocentrotus purpuratus]|uniref:CUB domain-containing protein n=1 Tax=Strongylocentrotus purpuratus TaxID=7668 RepID=A0A7M7NT84_STRPU|nr:uncharacterized protein LOC105445114 [Strongylocentrotus purpuratus]